MLNEIIERGKSNKDIDILSVRQNRRHSTDNFFSSFFKITA